MRSGGSSFDDVFRRLFEDQFGSLFRYLDRLSGDPDLAADIAQESFVRLYRRGALPRDSRAWLVTVANNLFRDERRTSRRRRLLLVGREPERTLGDPPAAADAALILEERGRSVRRALDTLPLRDRQALLLRYEGYSYREIAAALGIAESGVGTTLVRAMASFRSAYQETSGALE